MTNAKRAAEFPRGFVLLEMMIAVALFSLFAVVAFRLVSLSLRVATEVGRAEEAHRSFDAGLARLRADVWTASAVDVRAATVVALRGTATGGAVTWSIDGDRDLVRTEDRPGAYPTRQFWPGAGDGVTFTAEGTALVATLSGRRGNDAGRYRLPSLVMERGGNQ